MEHSSNNLAYDPDQDPEEKRDVRKKYRAIQKTTEEQRMQHKDYTVEELTAQVRAADALFHKVKNPQEATLDSHVLLDMSTTTAAKARAMKSGQGAFDIDDFVSKLITFMGGRKPLDIHDNDDDEEAEVDDEDGDAPLDWEKIGRKALAKSRRVPVLEFMLGPLSIEQKKRAQVKRAKLEKHKEDERKPQEIREEDIARNENETTKNVAQLTKLLEEIGTINLFKFIINPNDFGQSVENLFYLSFLIRDGVCAVEVNEKTREPTIFLCDQPNDQDYANGVKKRQFVMEFDMATWEYAIEIFNITEPTIPQRQSVKVDPNRWYG